MNQVRARLRTKPASLLSYHALTMLSVDLGWILRHGDSSSMDAEGKQGADLDAAMDAALAG